MSLQTDNAELRAEIGRLQGAARDLYFAAYWHPDRPVDEDGLWTSLRDAAGIEPSKTHIILGEDRSSKEGK